MSAPQQENALQVQLFEQILAGFARRAEGIEQLSDFFGCSADAVYRRLRVPLH